MAWTTPPTFVPADPLAAADLNALGADLTYLKGVTDGLSASGFRINRGSNQSIPDSTATAISFTSEIFDFGGWWSSGTTATVPAGAIPSGATTVLVEGIARAFFASNATGYRRIDILVNGSVIARKTVGAESTTGTDDETSDYFELAAGDTITMEVTHTAGSSINVTALLTVVRHGIAS